MTPSFAAFSEELQKMASIGAILRSIPHHTVQGWNADPLSGDKANWMGYKGHGNAPTGPGAMNAFRRFKTKLPIGAKSLTVGFTAAQLPGALSQNDPTGQERSRTERVSRLAGETVGGLAGSGMLISAIPAKYRGLRMAANFAGGMLGMGVGGAVAAAPFSIPRHARQAREYQNILANHRQQQMYEQQAAQQQGMQGP